MVLKNFWKLNICAWVRRIIFLLLFSHLVFAAQPDIYSFASDKDAQRFHSLTQELRCLVCQNQSLADSDAPLAKDLRNKIYIMINEKKSDEQIKQFLVSRYGNFILFLPPVTRSTLFLWLFPAVLLGLGLGMVFLLRGVSSMPLL